MSVWNTVIRHVTMAYILFIIPSMLAYVLITWLTGQSGRVLLFSIIPVIAVFLLLYILYLIKPLRFIRFWGWDKPEQ